MQLCIVEAQSSRCKWLSPFKMAHFPILILRLVPLFFSIFLFGVFLFWCANKSFEQNDSRSVKLTLQMNMNIAWSVTVCEIGELQQFI